NILYFRIFLKRFYIISYFLEKKIYFFITDIPKTASIYLHQLQNSKYRSKNNVDVRSVIFFMIHCIDWHGWLMNEQEEI
ncbi:hypothetical protein ACJX0J_005360, partial [Zea mays]